MNDTDGLHSRLEAMLAPIAVAVDVPLAPLTTFRIGGPADFLVRVRTADELERSVKAAKALDLPWFLLGHGANILVGDGGFRGLVIRCELDGIEFLDDGRVRAGSGVEMYPDLIDRTVARGLGGLHTSWAFRVP